MRVATKACLLSALAIPVHSEKKAPLAFTSISVTTGWDKGAKLDVANQGISHKKSASLCAKNSNDFFEGDKPDWWMPPSLESARRRARLAREEEIKSRFAQGDELRELRADLDVLRDNLKWAEAVGDEDRVKDLNEALSSGESRDAELVYAKALKSIEKAKKIIKIEKQKDEVMKYMERASMARACITRYNLDGLWVGTYGKHGSELINVTYSGDTLVATKVTGDRHVPRGEISFKVDLSPRDNKSNALDPVQLSESAASKWGLDKLSRYPGEGQVAAKGFKDAKYVNGQLIMFEDYFSFIWVPTRHHVFFSRPSPELTIHMLRDIVSEEDKMENMREHLTRCFEKDVTDVASDPEDYLHCDPFRRIHREVDIVRALEESQADEKQQQPKFSFWQVNMWKNYIDQTLREDKKE